MHRPSRPEDLDDAGQVWARAVLLALLDAAQGNREHWLDEQGVWSENGGGSFWWRLTLVDDGHAVFCGQDSDGSHTHVDGRQIDFLAGGPEWLPWEQLREDAQGNLFGFLYWWQDGAWHRIPYPDALAEDGLAAAAPWLGSERLFLTEAAELAWVLREDEPAFAAAVTRFLRRAEQRTVDAGAVAELLAAAGVGDDDREVLRFDPALDVAVRAGLTRHAPVPG
ncbi:hypothetical protein [Kitasatospora purpeofusca]|uniref:hypothetical protein n=1 Tax=Kitasatospora purpeofusca TaxID=67352 RepID=UPI0022523F97|nr:hypothetical protein [Kitasatospora purpeofusca]MCX4683473.1 hypothetical protein [Kitasatospora purpeofusca]